MDKPLPARVFESLFCIVYLIFVTVFVFKFMNTGRYLYALMAGLLGSGDAFHLIPRIINNLYGPFDHDEAALGLGNLISSITMTLFYVILSIIFDQGHLSMITIAIIILAIIRIGLCFVPANNWFKGGNPQWGVYRNIPFVMIGIIIVIRMLLVYQWLLGVLITLSFAFYMAVVLFAHKNKMMGMLMIPKTICYMIMLAIL